MVCKDQTQVEFEGFLSLKCGTGVSKLTLVEVACELECHRVPAILVRVSVDGSGSQEIWDKERIRSIKVRLVRQDTEGGPWLVFGFAERSCLRSSDLQKGR